MSATVTARPEPASAQYRRVRENLHATGGAPASAPVSQNAQEQTFGLLDARRVASSGDHTDDSESESENQVEGEAATGRGRKRATELPRRASPSEAAASLAKGEGWFDRNRATQADFVEIQKDESKCLVIYPGSSTLRTWETTGGPLTFLPEGVCNRPKCKSQKNLHDVRRCAYHLTKGDESCFVPDPELPFVFRGLVLSAELPVWAISREEYAQLPRNSDELAPSGDEHEAGMQVEIESLDEKDDNHDEDDTGEKGTLDVDDDPMVADPTGLDAAVGDLHIHDGAGNVATPPGSSSGAESSSDSEDGMPVSDLNRRRNAAANRAAAELAAREDAQKKRRAEREARRDAALHGETGISASTHRRSPGAKPPSRSGVSATAPVVPPAPSVPVRAGGMTGGFPGLFSLFGGGAAAGAAAVAGADEPTSPRVWPRVASDIARSGGRSSRRSDPDWSGGSGFLSAMDSDEQGKRSRVPSGTPKDKRPRAARDPHRGAGGGGGGGGDGSDGSGDATSDAASAAAGHRAAGLAELDAMRKEMRRRERREKKAAAELARSLGELGQSQRAAEARLGQSQRATDARTSEVEAALHDLG